MQSISQTLFDFSESGSEYAPMGWRGTTKEYMYFDHSADLTKPDTHTGGQVLFCEARG